MTTNKTTNTLSPHNPGYNRDWRKVRLIRMHRFFFLSTPLLHILDHRWYICKKYTTILWTNEKYLHDCILVLVQHYFFIFIHIIFLIIAFNFSPHTIRLAWKMTTMDRQRLTYFQNKLYLRYVINIIAMSHPIKIDLPPRSPSAPQLLVNCWAGSAQLMKWSDKYLLSVGTPLKNTHFLTFLEKSWVSREQFWHRQGED